MYSFWDDSLTNGKKEFLFSISHILRIIEICKGYVHSLINIQSVPTY